MLEPKAIETATKLMTVEGEEKLKAELNLAKKITMGETYAAYRSVSEHDQRFHQLIVTLSGNPFMDAAFRRAHCHLHLFRLNPTSAPIQKMAIREHSMILGAILSRNPKEARAAMSTHLENSRDRILPFILKQE
jgi:DNA-binding GntR family transcriptional regulator